MHIHGACAEYKLGGASGSLTPPEKIFMDLPIAEFDADTQPQIVATSRTERLGVYLDTAEQISGLLFHVL